MKSFIITLITVVIITLIGSIWAVSVNNQEVKLRNAAEAQKKSCEAYFDKMWKIINQDAQVAEKYKSAFKEIYVPLIEGRYSKGDGTLMKWIHEQNPTFSPAMYDKLMAAIEGERNGFFLEQQKLIDIDRVHKNLRKTWPSSYIVGDRKDIEYKIITSTVAKNVMATGVEDNITL